MYRVSKSVAFCYGHRLLNYNGKCAHLHGHNARAVITLESEQLDDLGMVEDFSRVKQLVWDWLDAEIDRQRAHVAANPPAHGHHHYHAHDHHHDHAGDNNP